jgi:hypothetical protein
MPLEVLQRNIILFRFLLVSKDFDMWRIANKSLVPPQQPNLTQLSPVIPTFSYVRLQTVKQNSKDNVSFGALRYV